MNRLLTGLLLVALATQPASARAQQKATLSFGVISQRSPVLTAQYWNPILQYLTARTGCPLELHVARTGPEHASGVGRGAFDFIYSNHNFAPGNDGAGYRVIARPARAAIRGQIVVLDDSPLRTIAELQDIEVAFPSAAAFVGYRVPIDALLRKGISVRVRFAGNQEGAMAQLKARRVAAIAVNSQVMSEFARREEVAYRVLWASEPFYNLPVSALPSVPDATVRAVRDALVSMQNDPEGARILAASAALIHEEPPFGFVLAGDGDYDSVRRVYNTGWTGKPAQ